MCESNNKIVLAATVCTKIVQKNETCAHFTNRFGYFLLNELELNKFITSRHSELKKIWIFFLFVDQRFEGKKI